jgi:hypothetical protein
MSTEASVRIDDLSLATPNADVKAQFRVKNVEGNRLELIGWAFGNERRIDQVEILSGDTVVAAAAPTTARPDVAKAHPDSPQAELSGFEMAIAAQGKGASYLRLRARLEDGTEVPLGTLRVVSPRRWSNFFRRP